MITNTTLEVVVPRSVVPAIYGIGGGCLREICEVSSMSLISIIPFYCILSFISYWC